MAVVETDEGHRVEFRFNDSARRRLEEAGFTGEGVSELELAIALVGTTKPGPDAPTRAQVAAAHLRIRDALAELKSALSDCDDLTRGGMETTFAAVCRIRLEDFELAVSTAHAAVDRVSKPFERPGKRGGAGFPHQLAVSIREVFEKYGIEATDASKGPFAVAYAAAAEAFGILPADPRNHLRYALKRAGK